MKSLQSTYDNTLHRQTPEKGDASRERQLVHTRVTVSYLPYGWVRWPAIILGSIGILGILSRQFTSIAAAFSFLNMPSVMTCCLIVAGALFLFGLSLFCRKTEKEIVSLTAAQPNWRSM